MKPFDNVIVSATEPEQKSDVWIQHAENIFDKNKANFINGYFNEESTSIATSSVSKCLYLEIEGNKEYCITKKASARFNVGTTSEVPNVGVNLIDNAKNVTTANTQKNASQIILKASVSAKYMIIWYYASNDDTLSENEILDSIIIKENIQDDILVNDNGVYNSVLTQDITTGVEFKTNKKIDGKDIYYKKIDLGTGPSSTSKSYAIGINFNNIIDANIFAKSTSTFLKLPFTAQSSAEFINYYFTGTNVIIQAGKDRSNFNLYLDIYYTK